MLIKYGIFHASSGAYICRDALLGLRVFWSYTHIGFYHNSTHGSCSLFPGCKCRFMSFMSHICKSSQTNAQAVQGNKRPTLGAAGRVCRMAGVNVHSAISLASLASCSCLRCAAFAACDGPEADVSLATTCIVSRSDCSFHFYSAAPAFQLV